MLLKCCTQYASKFGKLSSGYRTGKGQFSFLSQRKVKVTQSCPCWKLLRVPWTARRSNQSILKETNPEYSLEGLILKLKLQYFGHLVQRSNTLEKTLLLGKTEGKRRRGRQRMRWLDGITDSMDVN